MTAFYELSTQELAILREEGLSERGVHELQLMVAAKELALLEEVRAEGEGGGWLRAVRELQGRVRRSVRRVHPFVDYRVVPIRAGSWKSAYVRQSTHSGTGEVKTEIL